MAKFLYILLATLCFTQNFQKSLADSENDDDDDNFILNILKDEMADELQELSVSLFNNYEKNVQELRILNAIVILQILDITEEEIEELYNDSSLIVLKCTAMAYEGLTALIKKIETDEDDCIAWGKHRTNEVIVEMEQVIMEKAQSLVQGFIMKTMNCAQKFEDDNWVSGCYDFKQMRKMTNRLTEYIDSQRKIKILIIDQIGTDVDKCLKKVKTDVLLYTEHVIDEMEYCIGL